MVILVILIHPFPGNSLCDQISSDQNFQKKLFADHMGIPILVPIKITGNFPGKFFMTKIHGESHSHINAHTVTISHNSVFFM